MDPLELILAVKAAATNFTNTHSTMAEFKNVDAEVQAKRFAMWAFAAYKGYMDETTFEVEPDNEELQIFSEERHSKSIMPSLNQTQAAQLNMSDYASILEQLGRGLNRMGEANEAANSYAKRQMELKELEIENKKDRVQDLHKTTKYMLKMASATEPDKIGDLCDDLKSFYNSKNQGAASIN